MKIITCSHLLSCSHKIIILLPQDNKFCAQDKEKIILRDFTGSVESYCCLVLSF